MPTVMPQEISCRNWQLLFEYLENTPGFQSGLSGRAAIDRALEGLVDNPAYLVQDPDNPSSSFPITEQVLRNPKFWHSNAYSVKLFENVAAAIGGHRPLFLAGIVCGYRTVAATQTVYMQTLRMLPFSLLLRITNRINGLFNRTKDLKVDIIDKTRIQITATYRPGFSKEITRHVCDWNAGIYHGFGKYNGKQDMRLRETRCCTQGGSGCVFEIEFANVSMWRRLLIYMHSLLDPVYIRERDLDHMLLFDNKIRQTEIIRERTAALERAQTKIVEQEKMITEAHIAGGMAHEIRNALGAAKLQMGYISDHGLFDRNYESIQAIFNRVKGFDGLSMDTKKELVGAIRKLYDNHRIFKDTSETTQVSIDRGMQITQRVMAYSKLHEEDRAVEVVLNDILDSLVATYEQSLKANNIQLDVSIQQRLTVRAEPNQMHSVLQNLLLNARDAIEEKGQHSGLINITGYQHRGNVLIEVSDDGIGIPDANRDKIFQPFFSTKPAKGMGLGLSECRKIVTRAGATLDVDRRDGGGTTFRIRWTTDR